MNLAATSDDLILLLIFFGLYLLDCVVLLRPAQALTWFRVARPFRPERRGLGIAGRCRVSLDFGWTVYPLRGRTLALLNPLTPFVAVFKTRPIDDGEAGRPPISRQQMIALHIRTRRMSIALISHAVLMFVILPVLLLSGETFRLLIALAAAFVSATLILAVCYVDRRAARLPSAGFWSVAAPALLCLPTSLNAARKLALLASGPATATALLPAVPEAERPAALSELRLTLDRAAADGAQNLAHAAETQRRRLAAEYPEA
ncbi:hypothetical protein [Dongia sp.]|uniref:hypothetical protein n=1 Tax=Dongia sp. TaxID=1977262 RepID=UPI003750743B